VEKKLTVSQMADYLGVSKEAVYNRLRRGSLKSVIENGQKYVLLTKDIKKDSNSNRKNQTKSFESEYIGLLKTQVEELKKRNEKLESDKERLQNEITELLKNAKSELERIYNERDEQLKAILKLANLPTLGYKLKEEMKKECEGEIFEEAVIEEEINDEEIDIVEEICKNYEEWQSIDDFLVGFKEKKRLKIEKRLLKEVGRSKFLKYNEEGLFIKKGIKLKKILGKSE